ncbi:MAG: sensor histidine kinase [Gammaproteobacteria bacterium]
MSAPPGSAPAAPAGGGAPGQVPWLDRLAHDLRGPLAPLQTAAYLLKSGSLEPERQQELFELIERQTRRLTRMIDEVGDWSRANQGRLVGTTLPCEPAALLEVAMASSAGGGGAAPQLDAAAAGARIEGDQQRLVQMLRSLIEFAQARATAAAPTIRLHCAGGRLRLEILVAGPAPGTPEAGQLLRQPLPDPADEGLGLRLLIADAIARAHGGTLEALDADGALLLRCELPLARS